MNEQTTRILLVEDEEAHAELVRRAFERHARRFHLTAVGNLAEAQAYMAEAPPNLVITDWLLPDGQGTDLLPAEGEARHFPLVVMTSHGDEQVAVEAIKAGALDYVVKSGEALADMPRVVERALREWGHIVERKRVEEALRESEEKYRLLVENASEAITMMDEAGRFLVMNNAAAQYLGGQPQDFIGKTTWDILPQEVAEEHMASARDVIKSGQGHTLEIAISLHGETRWFHTSMQPIRDSSGKVTALLNLGTDITERKLAEKAMQESEERYRILAENSPNGIFISDAERFLYVNQRLCEITGFSKDELLSMSDAVESLIIPEERERAMARALRRLSGQPAPTNYEIRGIRKTGENVLLKFSVSPIVLSGRRVLQGTIENITEQKRLEEQIRQQEQMAVIGQLAGGIAHDFNNILATIMLYTQMFLRKPHLPPDLTPGLETILDESKQAAHLVRQILDFSRRSTMETQLVDLLPLVEKVMDILQRTLPANIHLLLEIEPAQAYIVNADPARIQQVMMNLAVNARDAMPAGGELRFSLSRVNILPHEEPPVLGMDCGKWMCLTVSDTGAGISPEAMDHLFEPFFTTKSVGKGTGLGLAQVHGIVELHQGYIGVKTEPAQGSTFCVYLPIPVEEREETVQAEATPATPEGTGETILLVEDGKKLRELTQFILESLGYRVLAAANGRKALEVYQSAGRIDLVITDMMMPRMGGRELMQELRKIDPALKGLALTGYALTEEREKLKQVGIVDFVQKPFDIDTIAEVVRQVLDAE